jgi:hypothetical protein
LNHPTPGRRISPQLAFWQRGLGSSANLNLVPEIVVRGGQIRAYWTVDIIFAKTTDGGRPVANPSMRKSMEDFLIEGMVTSLRWKSVARDCSYVATRLASIRDPINAFIIHPDLNRSKITSQLIVVQIHDSNFQIPPPRIFIQATTTTERQRSRTTVPLHTRTTAKSRQ